MMTTTKAMHTSVTDLTDEELFAAWDYCAVAADKIDARAKRNNGTTAHDDLQMRILSLRLTKIANETARRNLIDNEG